MHFVGFTIEMSQKTFTLNTFLVTSSIVKYLKGGRWHVFGEVFKAHLKLPKTIQESSVMTDRNTDVF